MPHRHEWLSRIKAVEREYVVVRQALDWFQESVRADPSILKTDLRPRDITPASEHLEGTYVIRLFAQFESGLRQYWLTFRDTHPKTEDLLNGIAARDRIPHDHLENAHAAREYRNTLVHEREEQVVPITVEVVRASLCRFFAFLPLEW